MKRTLCLLTALAFLLSCPAMAGAAKKEADPVPTCASCGQESAGQPFCPYCGAEETDNAGQHRPGSPRPGGVPAGSVTPGDAQAVADRYGISLKDGVPLYTPSDPQPLCAYIVLDSRCEAGLTQGGIQAVTSGTMPGELLNAVQACARKIHEYSEGMVRFVKDPDQADILISVLQSYSFKGDYASSGGGKAKGYSCKLTLTAYQLTYPAYTVSVSETNTPADSVRLSGGGTFWMDTPELYKNAQLPSFSETILYWYGYKKDRAIGPKDRHDLTRLMETLAARGYYSGKLSGFKDTDVTEAIRALQTGSGIIPTGKTTDLFTLSAVYFDDRTTEPFRDSYLRERVMDAGRTEQVCPGCSYLYRRDLGYGFCPHCGAKLPEYPSEGVRPAADQASPGDILTFGRYEQDGNLLNGLEPIEWIVLEEKDDLLLVISRYVLLGHQYKGQYSSVNGKTLFVSAWLNDQFRSAAFTRREQARIQYTKLPEQKTNGVYIFSLLTRKPRRCLPQTKTGPASRRHMPARQGSPSEKGKPAAGG